MKRLLTLCDCHVCSKTPKAAQIDEIFCVPLMVEVLVILLRNLSLVHPDTELKPCRSGLERLYRNYELTTNAKRNPATAILGQMRMSDMYDMAELVYTGRQEITEGRNAHRGGELRTSTPPVFSTHGMTFYLDILRELSDRPGEAGLLHAVPGNITTRSNRVYSFIRDLAPAGGLSYSATNNQSLSSLSDLKILDTSSPQLKVELIALEGVGVLSLELSFTKAGKFLYRIGLMELARRLAASSYSVFCPRRSCRAIDRSLTSVSTVDREGKVDARADVEAGRLVVIRQLHGNVIARCISLFQAGKYGEDPRDYDLEQDVGTADGNSLGHGNIILKADECWSCCLRAALSPSGNDVPVMYIT